MKVQVKKLDNSPAGDIELDDAIFGVTVKTDLLARAINWQLAKRRSGNHKTKGISDIRGTTKKPYKQKGTGNARQGSLRSPQFRGGARIFGPVVRSHEFDLPKKVRKLALKTALSSKAAEGKLIVLDLAKAESHKTKALAEAFEKMGLVNALVIDGNQLDQNFQRAARNIPLIQLMPTEGANVYDIMRRDTLVLTREAVTQLGDRLK
jgi:large subunit ribosomal protein L4